MEEAFPQYRDEADALDLLRGMLIFHPEKRITVNAALEHPFLQTLHNPDDEPCADFTFSFEYESEELSSEKIQELVWDEVRSFHPDITERVPTMNRRKSEKKTLDAKAESKSEIDDSGDGSKLGRKRSISPGADTKDSK
jgi:serine/threonine protein kinase